MQTTIGDFDAETKTVPVTFVHAGVTHERNVNACLDEGVYDEEATEARVADVARGVTVKIDIGVIVNVETLAAIDGELSRDLQ
jgi:hypothetical protein